MFSLRKSVTNFIINFESLIINTLISVIPKKKNLMLFGSGHQFCDNTKYLFLYVSHNTDYEAYWITSIRSDVKKLSQAGLKVSYKYSLRTIWLILRSKFFYVVSGIGNIFDFKVKANINVINLWHGTPIKKIWMDSKRDAIAFDGIDKIKKLTSEWKIFIVAHHSLIRMFSDASGISQKKIHATGLPRNDILHKAYLDKNFSKRIKENIFSFSDDDLVILYCPTHRDGKNDIKPIKKFILDFSKNLIDRKYHLVVRLHRFTDSSLYEELFKNDNVHDFTLYPDVQELLIGADFLVTDFSSVVFDFSILGKPFYFYTKSSKEYISKRGGLYYDLDTFPAFISDNPRKIFEKIETYNGKKKGIVKAFSKKFNCKNEASKKVFDLSIRLLDHQ